MTNVTWGMAALAAGTPDYPHNDQQTNLVDTLSNLMHAARLLELDFTAALKTAREHHDDEFAEEQQLLGQGA